jgi:hypothetical protein
MSGLLLSFPSAGLHVRNGTDRFSFSLNESDDVLESVDMLQAIGVPRTEKDSLGAQVVCF